VPAAVHHSQGMSPRWSSPRMPMRACEGTPSIRAMVPALRLVVDWRSLETPWTDANTGDIQSRQHFQLVIQAYDPDIARDRARLTAIAGATKMLKTFSLLVRGSDERVNEVLRVFCAALPPVVKWKTCCLSLISEQAFLGFSRALSARHDRQSPSAWERS
jgi:hypothetical protein